MSVGSVGNGTRYESGVSWEWDYVSMRVVAVVNGTRYDGGSSWEWD